MSNIYMGKTVIYHAWVTSTIISLLIVVHGHHVHMHMYMSDQEFTTSPQYLCTKSL